MSDYNFLMESRLSPEQFAVIALLSRLAAEQGFNLYLVGGAVRDLTYGQQVVRDLDFAVEGSPQRILRGIPAADATRAARGARVPAGEAPLALEHQEFDEYFNAAELIFSNGVRAELAMCREEIYSRSGQRPEVRPATVFEDLKRRDFAINAMAVSLHPNSRGLLLDPTNGAGDLERHEIRALQSRGFLDDPSRIYRLLRLEMRLDFKTEERTGRWLDAAWKDGAWERLDSNQQARELAAVLREDQPGRVLKMLAGRKILAGLDKKLASVHLSFDRFARIRTVLQSAPGVDPFLLNFHCLVEKLGPEHKARLAKLIIQDSKASKLALGLEHDAKKLERVLVSARANIPSQVYALLSPLPQPVVLYVLANTQSAKVQNRVKSFLFKFPQIHTQLPRAELQALGVKPGAEFDRVLSEVFALQLDGKIKSHPQLMKVMRELSGIKEPPPPHPLPSSRKGKEVQPEPPTAPRKKGRESPSSSSRSTDEKTTAEIAAVPPARPTSSAAHHGARVRGREAAPVAAATRKTRTKPGKR
jgi:tRNA nucleotidyltransferase/poly(A) polymerase